MSGQKNQKEIRNTSRMKNFLWDKKFLTNASDGTISKAIVVGGGNFK